MKKQQDIFASTIRAHLLLVLLFSALAAFVGAFIGSAYLSPHLASAQTAPLGNGGPAVSCADATITCVGGFQINLNLGNANTWTAAQTFPNIIDSGLAASSSVCTNGSSQLTTTSCSGGGGDTITSPNSSLTVGGTSSATTLDIALGHTNAFTAQENFVGAGGANACAGANFPATVYGICLGGNNGATNIIAAVIGPQSTDFACTTSCTAGNSERLRFYDSTATGAVNASELFYSSAAGAFDIGSPLIVGGRLITSSGADGGTCTPAAATSCTVTLGHTFGAPMCVAAVNTATAGSVVAVGWSVSSTTLTLTTAAAGSTPLSGWCWGNGS